MPGPQPTPTARLAQRGSWRAKTRDGEPAPPEGVAEPPAWVLAEAREHWDVIAPMLEGMGVMSPAYSAGLGLLVNSLGRYVAYEKIVCEMGPATTTDKGNLLVNPWWAARNKAWEQVLKVLREYGLTPAAMTSIRVPDRGNSKEQHDDMEAVLKLAGTSA